MSDNIIKYPNEAISNGLQFYKVVSLFNSKYWSQSCPDACNCDGHVVEYKLNNWTYHNIDMGPLFVFDSLHVANMWKNSLNKQRSEAEYYSYILFECNVLYPTKIGLFSSAILSPKCVVYNKDLVSSTWFASAVQLTKEITLL